MTKNINRDIQFPAQKSFFLLGPRQTGKSTLIKERFLENMWIVNLLHSEASLYFWRIQQDHEVDLVIEKHGKF